MTLPGRPRSAGDFGGQASQFARARGCVQTIDPLSASLSAAVVTQNGIFGGIVVWDSIPSGGVTKLTYGTGATVAGNVEVAILQADDDAVRTDFTRVARTGVVAIGAASSSVDVPLTAPFFPILWKPYWLVLTTDSATATFLRVSGVRAAAQFKAQQLAASSGGGATGIPATLNGLTANNGTMIWLAAS